MSSHAEEHRMQKLMADLKKDPLRDVSFDGHDKIIIVSLIAVFVGLFVWLLGRSDQPFYSYLTFLVVVTLVLVGILRAAGIFQTSILLLGGAAAVFVGLFLLTEKSYGKYYDQSEQINILKCSDPACAALKRYFDFIEKREFTSATSILSESWKQHQRTNNGPDYYEIFPTLFDTTVGYRNFNFIFRGEHDQTKDYTVSYDVTDEIPKNTLYDKRKQTLSSLSAADNARELPNVILADLKNYYVVPADKCSDIVRYIDENVTIDRAMDPFLISNLVVDLRKSNIVDLVGNQTPHQKIRIERHFVHRVTMSQDHDVWKILAFKRSYIANYVANN
jgi:hypothetical protein